ATTLPGNPVPTPPVASTACWLTPSPVSAPCRRVVPVARAAMMTCVAPSRKCPASDRRAFPLNRAAFGRPCRFRGSGLAQHGAHGRLRIVAARSADLARGLVLAFPDQILLGQLV